MCVATCEKYIKGKIKLYLYVYNISKKTGHMGFIWELGSWEIGGRLSKLYALPYFVNFEWCEFTTSSKKEYNVKIKKIKYLGIYTPVFSSKTLRRHIEIYPHLIQKDKINNWEIRI